jgi:hypothetical protein
VARTLPAALSTEFEAAQLKPFYAVELDFDSGVLRFWTGYGTITANGEEWDGAGTILGISSPNENIDLSADGLTITFTGLDSSIVAITLTQNYRGRSAKVYMGALDGSNEPVSDLYQVFAGRMDVMTIQEDGQTATVSLQIENVLIDLERARTRKYTDEEQRKRFAGDASLENVAALQDRQISWGR